MSISNFFSLTLIVAIVLILFSHCTYTTTTVKDPEFAKHTDSVARDVNSVILTKRISLHGVENKTNGKISSELTIDLINPVNAPSDSAEANKMYKEIAILIKQDLKDHNAYTSYTVRNVHEETNDAITKSNYTGLRFDASDLTPYFCNVTLGNTFDTVMQRADGKTTFTNNDSEIVTVLNSYNLTPNLSKRFHLYKQTDSGEVLFFNEDMGKLDVGYYHQVLNLGVHDFYTSVHLKTGNYRIEWLINDSMVGTKNFVLQ